MKDLTGRSTVCVVSLRSPMAVQRANGTQAAAQIITCDRVVEGNAVVSLVHPKSALVDERQARAGPGGKDVVSVTTIERDLESTAPIIVPYANLAGWTIVEETED